MEKGSKIFTSPEFITGIAVAGLAFVFEKVREHASFLDITLTVILALLCAVISAFVAKVQIYALLENISTAASDAIKDAVDSRLNHHMEHVTELTSAASHTTKYLQASNPESDLSRLLLTADDICELEKHTRERVFVVMRDLAFDRQIDSTVTYNLRHEKDYYYFYPEGSISQNEISKYRYELSLDHEALQRLHFIAIPKQHFNFLTDVVIYDPHKSNRRGYVRLPADELPGGVRAILIKGEDPLRDLGESLSALISQYGS